MKESASKNEGWGVECACSEKTIVGSGLRSVENESRKLRRSKRKLNSKRKIDDEDECQPSTRDYLENESFEFFSEHESAAEGGDGAENRKQRLRCRQHELNPSWNEINRSDVITSCDLTSNSAGRELRDGNQNKNGRRDCPSSRMSTCSTSQSTCSEGSYSRRKHHKHHKHKQKSKSPLSETVNVSPKVNPIFLWVRQEDTRIVEVLCEDYDHRNRLKLRRTHLGWRAIPKTKRFAEAIQAKVTQDGSKESLIKPKKTSKIKKGKKKKKEKNSKKLQKILSDNPNLIKECSVALCRDDLTAYNTRALVSLNDVQKDENFSCVGRISTTDQNLNPNSSHSSSLEPITVFFDDTDLSRSSRTLIKSNSCDFPSLTKISKILPRSISLDLNEERNGWEELLQALEIKKPDISVNVKEVPKEIKYERDKIVEMSEKIVSFETGFDGSHNQRNHSESIVIDTTKHDSDFNEADCDELGQLLKVIPDLEFVEEGELEEVDEEEWSTPTDLTLPKSSVENKSSCVNLPLFPLNISPLITVTSTVRPSEPLTAPLPEVTITPIPKPAHQQKPKNNFLESLLSSAQSVKPEEGDPRMNNRQLFGSLERKTKHLHDNGLSLEFEVKNKKLKAEDITLKSLLSKHCGEKEKPVHLEKWVQNLKTNNGEECQKSRLQELLTDNVCSDPISQLKEVLSNPLLAVPDPLLVPRARLPALVASPASEIPRLLTMHLGKTIEEKPFPPITDSDVLEVSLSNLQSLLSSNLEKVLSANTQDLANYQKSLEMFLGWQRYQTELIETEMKNSKAMPAAYSSDIADVGTTTTLSQMLWLPYLNQFDFNANRNIMSLMNTMLNNECQANKTKLIAPPQINTSQVSQPSPFLTPTSPMDIESHLKTLAMWQEAFALQQNSQLARSCSNSNSALIQDSMKSGKIQYHSVKKQFYGTSEQKLLSSGVSCEGDPSHRILETSRDGYQKNQRQLNIFENKLKENIKNAESLDKYKQEPQNQVKRHKNLGNHQNETSRHSMLYEKKKPSHRNITVKPLSNLIGKNNYEGLSKSSWQGLEEEPKKKLELADKVAMRLQQFNTQIQRTKVKKERPFDCQILDPKMKQNNEEVPKLKVKNLVDPNMSPPKLLKQIAPEHLPIVMDEREAAQDESQGHLWHPLFGSNQIKAQPYNSPWRWTTVTVNGE